MAADVLDDNPQLNELLLSLRDAVRRVIRDKGYGHIIVDGVIHAGVIVGTVDCGVCPRKYFASMPKSGS